MLIPWAGAADDHQTLNAASFAAAGAATVLSDAQLTAHALRKAIDAIIGDAARQATMEQAMRSLARPNAAQEMADELLRLAEESTR